MVKITVMVPVELEVNVTAHGELRIMASRTPIERQDCPYGCQHHVTTDDRCDSCNVNAAIIQR